MARQVAVVALLVVGLLALSAGCLGALGEPVQEGADDGGGGAASADGEADETGDADGPADAEANGTLAVHFLDVGQGDAALVVGPAGETVLIDTGDWRDDGETVIAYLEARGVDRIDHLVSTHAHADHVGGAASVIEHYETERDGVGAVWDSGVAHTTQTYERYLDAIDEHDVTLYETREGDEVPLEGANVTVINPPAERESEDLDDNSVGVRIRHGEAAFLFTGDARHPAEERIVDRWGAGLHSTVLQAGHHGSHSGTGDALLDAVEPRAVVVSSAYDSQYDHPHDELLDRLAGRQVDVYWTGVHGTIVAESDGTSVAVATQVAAPTDPGSIRDAPEANARPSDPVEERATYGTNSSVPTASGDSEGATPALARGTAPTDGGVAG